MECKHKNKELIDYKESYSCGCDDFNCDAPGMDLMDCPNLILTQHRVWKCKDCGEELKQSR